MDAEKQAQFAAWEQEMAAYWETALRNPDFLRAAWRLIQLNIQARQMARPTPHNAVLRQIAELRRAAGRLEWRLDRLLAELTHE